MWDFLKAAAAGGVVALVGYLIFKAVLDRQFKNAGSTLLKDAEKQLHVQLRKELEAEVPKQVRTEMHTTLRGYGITPDTGKRLNELLARADKLGLI